jgi:negative regulator of sigma E activity
MSTVVLQPTSSERNPWWRNPMVWLVISGPLAVVLACVVTAVFIVKHPDPPLPAEVTQMHPADEVAAMKQATSVATSPAMSVRNHAAQPIDPRKP